jgi:hypothetical protein
LDAHNLSRDIFRKRTPQSIMKHLEHHTKDKVLSCTGAAKTRSHCEHFQTPRAETNAERKLEGRLQSFQVKKNHHGAFTALCESASQ